MTTLPTHSSITVLIIDTVLGCIGLGAQSPKLGVPSITAATKGPDQINLTWAPVPNPGYGYLVEIQSPGDVRYHNWTELQPLPIAGGYTCESTIAIRGGYCNISDPSGLHVYNPPNHGVPYWVTESNYTDPQDETPAQFIACSLKPNTPYTFRVRSYSGQVSPTYGDYSRPVTATTSNYTIRYVSSTGNDSNDGSGQDQLHAWRTLLHAGGTLRCGEVLIVMGGNYSNDQLSMAQTCSPQRKAVVLVNPGETAAVTSVPAGVQDVLVLGGKYLVIDGLISVSASPRTGEYDVIVAGSHNALLNVEVHPPVVPMAYGGVLLHGDHNLIYRCNLHDYYSPDAMQNPSGNGGFVLTVEAGSSSVIWSNHLTRGGHDVSLCVRGCSHNRWLNNIMDGGWGMGFEAIQQSTHNLIEGNYIKDVGQLVAFYKPSIELSSAFNTVRRTISINGKSNGLEVSSLYGGDTAAGALVYNNVFYHPGACYFQSHNGGISSYDQDLYANNICYRMDSIAATDIYLGNKNSKIVNNTFLFVDVNGAPQPDKPILIWNHEGGGDFQYPKPVSYADKVYNPPFSHNNGLNVPPKFVDEARLDLHLASGSPLIGAGARVQDTEWGSAEGKVDVGAFGINPAEPPMVKAHDGAIASSAVPDGTAFRLGTPQLDRATVMTLGLTLPIIGDLNYSSTVMVRYREAGTTGWREAMPLFRVHPDVIVGFGVQPHFAGSIFDLKPGTQYEIELHAVDPDGRVDQRLMLTGSTRTVPGNPVAPRVRPVRDSAELAAALGSARPGDVITLAGGVYSGQFAIKAAGNPENTVIIRGATEEGTILDGKDCTGCNVLEVYGAGFVHIERLTIRNAERAIRFQTAGSRG